MRSRSSHLARTRRHDSTHWRRRVALVAFAAAIVGLFLLASRFEPTEAAANLERVIHEWIDRSGRPR